MDPHELLVLEELFHACLDLPEGQRSAFLDMKCPTPGMREDLVRMIQMAASERPGPGEDAPEIGKMVGPYKLLQRLGEGGFGVVYRAEQAAPIRREVALKILKSGLDTTSIVARFHLERQALAMMEHEGIARVLDAGEAPTGGYGAGRPYFAMELVRGEAITDFCTRAGLGLEARVRLFIEVCEAMQHAHQKGMIHRDLKPSNILVEDGQGHPRPKIIDFGVAKWLERDETQQTLTEQGHFIGTPEYMSPEQMGGGAASADVRSDVYSLGVVLYELIAGSRPFKRTKSGSDGWDEIRQQVRESEPARPSTRLGTSSESKPASRQVRGELDWIVMKCLEKPPERRYAGVSELMEDLRRFLRNETVAARPPSVTYRARKFVRRNRVGVAFAGAVALAAVVGAVVFAWQAEQTRRQRDRAIDAEVQTAKRAEEVEKVVEFQATMLSHISPTKLGESMSEDVRKSHLAGLSRLGLPEGKRGERAAAFENDWNLVNATDAAKNVIDGAILKPSVDALAHQFKDHPLVDAKLRHIIGVQYETLGDYEAAATLLRQALEIRRKELKPDNPDLLKSINEVGVSLYLQYKFAEAEPYFREALEGRTRTLGVSHRDTLLTMHTLGSVLSAQRKLADAEPIIREALRLRRATFGEDDRDSLVSLNELAMLLESQDRLEEATVISRELLERRRRVLGDDDRQTINAINNLGSVLKRQKKLDEAEPYCREALERSRRVIGDDHPDTLISIHNMGFLLFAQQKYAEAEVLWRESLEKRQRKLGDNDPRTIISLSSLGTVLRFQGRLDEADPYLTQSLERMSRVRGEGYAEALQMRDNLAAFRLAQGRRAEAVALSIGGEAIIAKSTPPRPELLAKWRASIVKQYTDWDAAEPGKGYDTKATEWKAKLEPEQLGGK